TLTLGLNDKDMADKYVVILNPPVMLSHTCHSRETPKSVPNHRKLKSPKSHIAVQGLHHLPYFFLRGPNVMAWVERLNGLVRIENFLDDLLLYDRVSK